MRNLNTRVEDRLLDRARALIVPLRDEPALLAQGNVTVSTVVRYALLLGIEKLEQAQQEKPTGSSLGRR
jgi:hypothetical protein